MNNKTPSYLQNAPAQQFDNNSTKPRKKRRFIKFLRNYFIIMGMLTTAYLLMRGIIELLVLLNMIQNTVK
ncbi:MAG: hypothetical protein GYA87_01790 [Christensenellaceae bacterium]|nr:hypothetical protein [Christensenellaceae bacterium]